MAWTIVRNPSVMGNKRVVGLTITPDSATFAVETGLSVVEYFTDGPASMNSSNIHIAINSNCSGVQSMGVLGVTGCTSGDLFCLTVFGR